MRPSTSTNEPGRVGPKTPAANAPVAGTKPDSSASATAGADSPSMANAEAGSSGGSAPMTPNDAAGSPASAGARGSAGAGGSGTATAGLPPSADRGPYFTSGRWQGFFWIARHGAGTTLTPSNFTAPTFETPVCIKGSVAATADNSGNAIVGVNLKQEQRVDAPPQAIAPSRAGIEVGAMNNGGSPLRVEVQALDGATNFQARWCAVVSGSGGFIPWTQFNTSCWDDTGTPYRRELISAAMLIVPGTTDAAVTYDVCLVRLAEADAPPPAAAGSGGSPAAAGSGGSPAVAGGGGAAGRGGSPAAAGSGG